MSRLKSNLAALVLALAVPGAACAQDVFVYPEKGQSAEKQAQDKAECSQWATNETGYNPFAPPPPQAQAAPTGGLLRGAARGALLGTAVGAIAGDTGKGAAIGATAGGLGGAMRKRDNQMVAEQQNQQAGAQQQAKADAYKRAIGACLQARGYSVQ